MSAYSRYINYYCSGTACQATPPGSSSADATKGKVGSKMLKAVSHRRLGRHRRHTHQARILHFRRSSSRRLRGVHTRARPARHSTTHLTRPKPRAARGTIQMQPVAGSGGASFCMSGFCEMPRRRHGSSAQAGATAHLRRPCQAARHPSRPTDLQAKARDVAAPPFPPHSLPFSASHHLAATNTSATFAARNSSKVRAGSA